MNDRIDYVPAVSRQRIAWPNGARIAFYVGFNIESFDYTRPNPRNTGSPLPDMVAHLPYEYGTRSGVFRVMEVLDKYGIRASVLLNSEVCERFPAIIEEGSKRGWEWLGHGITNQRLMGSYPPEEERAVIRQVKETIIAATGTTPKGWLGPGLAETFRTPDHLATEGFDYLCDWGVDDQPLPMKVESGRMIGMPYQQGLNDIPLLSANLLTGEQYCNAVCDAFDALYEEAEHGGKVMALPIHPFYVGQPMHKKHFSKALEYITSHEGVWTTTSGEIAAWYYGHYVE